MRRILRWLRRIAVVSAAFLILAATVVWIWPLHVQAWIDTPGGLLTERVPWEAWEEAFKDENFGKPGPEPLGPPQNFFPAHIFAGPDHDYWWATMLTSTLLSLREPRLYPPSAAPASHVYRVTWLRSFDPPIAVRMEVQANGSASLVAKHHSYHPLKGEAYWEKTRHISRWRTSRLIRKIERAGFWVAPAEHEVGGIDGATWLLEACRDGRYHLVERWSPGNFDPFKSVCLDLLEAGGIWRGPVY